MDYIKQLEPLERASAIKLGMAMSMADNNMTVAGLHKQADMGNWSLVPKSILTASMLGIPLGMVAHWLGNASAPNDAKIREELERIKYYRRMTNGVNDELERVESAPDADAGTDQEPELPAPEDHEESALEM